MTDGGEKETEEDASSQNSGVKDKVTGFLDRIGIGGDHVAPKHAVEETFSEDPIADSAEELSSELEDLDEVVSSFDSTRSELEADIQATAQAYETEISGEAVEVASKLNSVLGVARSDLNHIYDFNPDRGTHSLEYEGPEESATSTDYGFDIDGGLATFLEEGARVGDLALSHFNNLAEDMEDLAEERENKKEELNSLKERNEDQLEQSRSEFMKGEEQERAERIRDAENEADEERIDGELESINQELERKRPRKEEHLEAGNNVLNEVRETYQEHSNYAKEQVREISDELGHLTDSLGKLTSVDIGSMEEMLEEAFEDTDVDLGPTGKYLNDAEGELKEAYREAVNDLSVKVARQYAQAEKAIEELDVIEERIGKHTDRLDLGASEDLEDIIGSAFDGEDMETYLEDQVSGILDSTYSARDEVRNIFRGLEELRDEDQRVN